LYGGLTLAMCFWAFSFIWYKLAYRYLEPMALIFFRLVVASVFVTLILVLSGKFEKIQKKDYRVFLLLVFLVQFCWNIHKLRWRFIGSDREKFQAYGLVS